MAQVEKPNVRKSSVPVDTNKCMDDVELLSKICKRLYNSVFQIMVSSLLLDDELKENPAGLTSQEIIDKVRAFLAQEPDDVNSTMFLNYLVYYPVSMCSREVSPLLRLLIGFHYRLGAPDQKQAKDGIEKTSYEDLAQLFCRSKATISDCVNRTEDAWREFQESVEKEKAIDEAAHKQLVEQRVDQLKTEQETNEGTTK